MICQVKRVNFICGLLRRRSEIRRSDEDRDHTVLCCHLGAYSLAYVGKNYYYLKLFLFVLDLFTERVKG